MFAFRAVLIFIGRVFFAALTLMAISCSSLRAESQWVPLPHFTPQPSIVVEGEERYPIEDDTVMPMLVRDIGQIERPSTLGQAADLLEEIFTPEDYEALLKLYGLQSDISMERVRDVQDRIQDIQRYIYEGWRFGDNDHELSRLLNCSVLGPNSVDIIVLLAVNWKAGDTDRPRDHLVSVSTLLSDRLRSKCIEPEELPSKLR